MSWSEATILKRVCQLAQRSASPARTSGPAFDARPVVEDPRPRNFRSEMRRVLQRDRLGRRRPVRVHRVSEGDQSCYRTPHRSLWF